MAGFWSKLGRIRPHIAIYLVAGLTLLYVMLGVIVDCGKGYEGRHTIRTLELTGDELFRAELIQSDHWSSALEGLVLMGTQVVIVLCTRKLIREQITSLRRKPSED